MNLKIFRLLILSVCFLQTPQVLFGQNLDTSKVAPQPVKKSQSGFVNAIIVEDGAIVFEQDNFDSDPMAELRHGEVVEVSRQEFGRFNFHRVKLKDGRLGYIADNDFRVPGQKIDPKTKTKAEKLSREQKMKERRKHLPFVQQSHYGFTYDYIGYRESTLGLSPTYQMGFYGVKVEGPGLLMEGDGVTEFNLNMSFMAPGYYQQATGNGASGFIVHMDTLLMYPTQQSKNVQTFFGLGPMLRYSHFQAGLTKNGIVSNYSLDDMTIGACFDLGLAFRLPSFALRVDWKYYWETMQYNGFGASLLIPF